MAITIVPRRAGTSARRGRGIDLPGAGDIRVPSPASDPGVAVPAGAFGGNIAAEAARAGEIISVQQAQAAGRIRSREDTFARNRSRIGYNEFVNTELRKMETEGDLTDPAQLEEFGATIAEKKAELLQNHAGSEDSRARLGILLDDIEARVTDSASVKSIEQGRKMIDGTLAEAGNRLAAKAARQPGNVLDILDEVDLEVDEVAPAMTPSEEQSSNRKLRAQVAESAVTGYLRRRAPEEALALLDRDEVAAALGPEKRRALEKRILSIEPASRVLTPGETAKLGFPEGVIVQKKGDGSIDVVFEPEKDETLRQQKIDDLIERGVEKNRAQDIVDGNIRVEIVPGLGVAREVNEVDGTAREIALGPTEQQSLAEATTPPQRSLFDLARSGAIAGFVPATQEFLGRTVGQLPFVPVATDVIAARQEIQVAQNELIRALSINPRFPVAEIKRIRDEIKIEPAVLDSERALLARMAAIDRSLRIRLVTEKTAASNTSLPQDVRSDASQAAKDIENFIRRLGVPEDFDPANQAPEGIPDFSRKIGVTRKGKDVWESPDGRRWVVD